LSSTCSPTGSSIYIHRAAREIAAGALSVGDQHDLDGTRTLEAEDVNVPGQTREGEEERKSREGKRRDQDERERESSRNPLSFLLFIPASYILTYTY
jgi:hypothetical protein